MSTTPRTGSRRERHDTKTLVRLGTERESGPVLKAPATGQEPLAGGRRANVHLWFPGVREPVRACAELSDTVLALDAPLPFLELDSVVECMPVDGGGLLHGRIRSVELEAADAQGVPRLRVTVDLDEGLDVEDADDADDADDASDAYPALAAEHATPAAHDGPPHAPKLDTLPPTRIDAARPGALTVLAAVAVGLAAGAGAAYAWIGLQPLPQLPPAAALVAPPQAPVVKAAIGPRIEPPSIVIALAAESTDTLAAAHAAPWLSEPEPLAQHVVTPPQLLDDTDDAELTAPPEVAFEPQPSDLDAASVTGSRGFLQVQATGTQTRVFVPMSGSAEGLREYALTTPGVAINLPHAVALSPLENYAVGRGLVRRVWLRRERGGVQVRVITRRAASRVSTRFDEHGLTVVLDM